MGLVANYQDRVPLGILGISCLDSFGFLSVTIIITLRCFWIPVLGKLFQSPKQSFPNRLAACQRVLFPITLWIKIVTLTDPIRVDADTVLFQNVVVHACGL